MGGFYIEYNAQMPNVELPEIRAILEMKKYRMDFAAVRGGRNRSFKNQILHSMGHIGTVATKMQPLHLLK